MDPMLFIDNMEERKKVRKAAECCKKILNHINQSVKEAENQQVGVYLWMKRYTVALKPS